MKHMRIAAALMMIAGLSACANPQIASRNAPFEVLPVDIDSPERSDVVPVVKMLDSTPEESANTLSGDFAALPDAPVLTQPKFQIVDYAISVPKDLTVSEANLYYPIADIVWRGDPAGDRKAQIGRIFQGSLQKARAEITEGTAVKAEITLTRFHSVTEKTRYTVGGNHNIEFNLVLRDAETGAIVHSKAVATDLQALGGRRAMQADAQGLTMKKRIDAHLTRVLKAELTLPQGWDDQDRKLATAVDQI